MYQLFNKIHIIQLIYKKLCKFNIIRLNFYMSNKNDILQIIAEYVKNIDLFIEKGNKSASTRARKALADLVKIARNERKFILEYRINKPDMSTASTANRSTASTANRSTASTANRSTASTANRSTASTANRSTASTASTANRSTASTASTANRSTASTANKSTASTASTANRPNPTSPYEQPKNLPTSDFYTTPTFNKYK